MTQTTILLITFSVQLKRTNPFMEVSGDPVYTNGDFRIYRYYKDHFVHTFKNIVICERCAPNTGIIENLLTDNKPAGEAAIYQ